MMTYYIIDDMRWVTKKNPFKRKSSLEALLKLLLWNRGIRNDKEIDAFLDPICLDKIDLSDTGIDKSEIVKAGERINQCLANNETVLIYGDYDVDGFCGSALVWEGLFAAGLKVIPYIPDRNEDGYGLNKNRVLKIKKKFSKLSLVVTVDNGIVANEAVSGLKKKGVDTIIIDHHLPGKTLPESLATVHSTLLSGSGVAWFFIKNLALSNLKLPDPGLAALGTVADMLPVLGINRSIIKYGSYHLEKTKRPGLKNLFHLAGVSGPIDTQKIAFNIAPRLNALGRISDSLDGLRLVCVRDEKKGLLLAKKACRVNSKRQDLTNSGFTTAEAEFLKAKPTQIITSSSSSYHRGIVGLIAGKLTNKYNRPAVIISIEDGLGHGSARSVEGFNIVKALRKLNDMLVDVGGHPLAAGFTISVDKIPLFTKRLNAIAENKLDKKTLQGRVDIDKRLSLSEANLKTYQQIQKLAPFGINNPQPIFSFRNLRVVEVKTVGSERKHLKLLVDDPKTARRENIVCELIGFGFGDWIEKIASGDFIDIAACLDENVWQGRRKIVLRLVDLKRTKKMLK
jgi:single-stranded-DNA-specific exonuclease